jgi:hypothetical protein
MTTHEDATALVRRMQECFNGRRFDDAAELHAPGVFSHPLAPPGSRPAGTPGASSPPGTRTSASSPRTSWWMGHMLEPAFFAPLTEALSTHITRATKEENDNGCR